MPAEVIGQAAGTSIGVVMTNKYVGSSFDEWLAEEGILKEVTLIADERVSTWQTQRPLKSEHTKLPTEGPSIRTETAG